MAGFENSEDAGVFKLSDDTALVQTLDFLTPVVDDPFIFGQIAAANSLSDIYAMGGKPLTAMNIVCFPSEIYSANILKEALAGGRSKIDESGSVLMGGHSVEDTEFKYGLSVTGLVHPKKFKMNSGAEKGDVIIITKSLGTGIISTALKGDLADKVTVDEMIFNMTCLNSYILDIIGKYHVGGLTDVTGFGFAGHLMEMAKASGKKILIDSSRLPVIEKAYEFAQMGLIPAGAYRNREYCKGHIVIDNSVDKGLEDILFDPQTSGGLIFTTKNEFALDILQRILDNGLNAEIIGEVSDDSAEGIIEFF